MLVTKIEANKRCRYDSQYLPPWGKYNHQHLTSLGPQHTTVWLAITQIHQPKDEHMWTEGGSFGNLYSLCFVPV